MKKDELEYIDFKQKYKSRLAKELGDTPKQVVKITTRDYEKFKQSFMPKQLSYYEKLCSFAEKVIPISPDKKKIPKIEEAIRISHINASPTGVTSFALLMVFLIIFSSVILGYFVPFVLTGGESADNFFFILFGIIMGLVMFIPLSKLPFIIANVWRMKSSNQMVLAVFYIVTYMRHTPNLELAIDFAAEHLRPPLSLDLKKVMWDIETGKFDNVTESLDFYLQTWREWNPEFIESMHLIESSLYESNDVRRLNALDKSLSVILEETYEKMLHFTHNLKSPITALHMLGIVLPILGLVILPLLTAFVPEVRWYHLFALYNLALPILVYYLGREVLSTRPTGYSGIDVSNLDADVSEDNKITFKFSKDKSKGIALTPMAAASFIIISLLFIGIFPLMLYAMDPDTDYYLTERGFVLSYDADSDERVYAKMLDYRDEIQQGMVVGRIGPYGLGASLLSLALPLAFGLGIGLYYKWKYSKMIKIREHTSKLEQEFASALFQLGNRLGDGVPAEIAFHSVARNMQGTESGKFFDMVTVNIVKLGMGVEEAIFDREVGALKHFPSSIIESSMKVFVESIRKGPLIASQALLTIAEYIKSMHRVDERLKDLMADVVSSMRSQVAFLTPAISGIVVGITSMISQILGALAERFSELGEGGAEEAFGGAANIMDMFGSGGVPTYFFQAIVGLYVVQITYILTYLVSGIENGSDEIYEKSNIGRSLVMSTITYVLIAGIFTVMFSIIAGTIIAGIAS